jgi:hypothetical protein
MKLDRAMVALQRCKEQEAILHPFPVNVLTIPISIIAQAMR